MKQENYIKGMVMIILSAFFFACMNVSVRLAGDLPSVQKSFFRNLVAAFFAVIILAKNHVVPKVQKAYWGPLIMRCTFGTLGILCNYYAIDHLLVLCNYLFISDSERKDHAGTGGLRIPGIYRMPVCCEAGISEYGFDPGTDRSLRGTWRRNRVYDGPCTWNTWDQGTDYCILFFCVFLPVCASVSYF